MKVIVKTGFGAIQLLSAGVQSAVHSVVLLPHCSGTGSQGGVNHATQFGRLLTFELRSCQILFSKASPRYRYCHTETITVLLEIVNIVGVTPYPLWHHHHKGGWRIVARCLIATLNFLFVWTLYLSDRGRVKCALFVFEIFEILKPCKHSKTPEKFKNQLNAQGCALMYDLHFHQI